MVLIIKSLTVLGTINSIQQDFCVPLTFLFNQHNKERKTDNEGGGCVWLCLCEFWTHTKTVSPSHITNI